jgi:hypothetical protein
MVLQDFISSIQDVGDAAKQLESGLKILQGIKKIQYLQGCTWVIKAGQLHLAWDYAQSSEDHQWFVNMLWVSPGVFQVLLHHIANNSFQVGAQYMFPHSPLFSSHPQARKWLLIVYM